MSTPAPDTERAEEIAAEVAKITDAADAARPLLDFNDEPARFEALLNTAAKALRSK